MSPLISVITITLNAERVLPQTVVSVRAQSFKDYEYIVIDGGSSDDTLSIVESAGITRVTVVSEPDNGLYDAMNKGLSVAKGDYVLFLNAGDAFADNRALERIAAQAGDMPGVIYGQTRIVDSSRKVIGPRHLTAPEELTASSFSRGMLVCHQAFIARRDIVGEYDRSYRYSADYDWCIRCLERSERNAYLGDDPIVDYLAGGLTDKFHIASLRERFVIMRRHYGVAIAVIRHVSFIFRAVQRWIKRKQYKFYNTK